MNARSILHPLRVRLAERWSAFGDPWMLRLLHAAGDGEPDMRDARAEQVYAALYLDCIDSTLPARSGLRILDAGCQAGRLAIPLARAGHHVTGLDISERWLDLCRRNASAAGVSIDLVHGPLEAAPSLLAQGGFDAVICAEVLYTIEDLGGALRTLAGLMAPDGALFTSHRTRHYMLTTLARFRRWLDLSVVAGAQDGRIFEGQYYSWFDEPELRALYATAGLAVEAVRGIGTVSGVGVDGTAALIDAERLDDADLQRLLSIERACSTRFSDAARYRLLVSRHSTGTDR